MNERQEQTADVLGKLTVLGTIVLPMNIITGMWGMNVLVPGQNTDNLYWFWSSKSKHPLRSLFLHDRHSGPSGDGKDLIERFADLSWHSYGRPIHVRLHLLLHREESLWHRLNV